MEVDDTFEPFVRSHRRSLVRVAYLILGDRAGAEDAVQTALMGVLRRWDKISESHFFYARTAVIREAVSHRSKSHRLSRLHSGNLNDGHTGGIEALESRLTLWPLVRELPTKQRAVLVLRYYLDLSEQEIATALRISAGTVKSHHARAIAKLKTQVGSDHPTPKSLEESR